jgi:hypothetical protein
MTMLIGTGPNQVPTNSMLGGMAYQDPEAVQFTGMPWINGAPVIERGDTANGAFVRFGDGTQICFHTLPITLAAGAVVAIGWTYPAAFVFSILPLAQYMGSNSTGISGGLEGTTFTEASGFLKNNGSSSATGLVQYMAIGRWK